MGFVLFIVAMLALSLMSTTKESRDAATLEYAWTRKYWRAYGLISAGILLSMFIF